MSLRLGLRLQSPVNPSQTRGVLHNARLTRKPILPEPTTPRPRKPTHRETASRPRPHEAHIPSRLVLQDTGASLHHIPPPSAPTYTAGMVPDVLRWADGEDDVRASAQAGAPAVRPNAPAVDSAAGWVIKQETVEQIRKLRAEDPVKWTRKALAQKYVSILASLLQLFLSLSICADCDSKMLSRFNIPSHMSHQIAWHAPIPKAQQEAMRESLAQRKSKWGFNKAVAREARVIRRSLW